MKRKIEVLCMILFALIIFTKVENVYADEQKNIEYYNYGGEDGHTKQVEYSYSNQNGEKGALPEGIVIDNDSSKVIIKNFNVDINDKMYLDIYGYDEVVIEENNTLYYLETGDAKITGNGVLNCAILQGTNLNISGNCTINCKYGINTTQGIVINSGTININWKEAERNENNEEWLYECVYTMGNFEMNGGILNIDCSNYTGDIRGRIFAIDSWGDHISIKNATLNIKIPYTSQISSCIEPGSSSTEGECKLIIENSNCTMYAANGHVLNCGWSPEVILDDNSYYYAGIDSAQYRVPKNEIYLKNYSYPVEVQNYVKISTTDLGIPMAKYTASLTYEYEDGINRDDVWGVSVTPKNADGSILHLYLKSIKDYTDTEREMKYYIPENAEYTFIKDNNDKYEIKKITVNNQEIKDGESYKVTGDMNIVATIGKKTQKEIESEKKEDKSETTTQEQTSKIEETTKKENEETSESDYQSDDKKETLDNDEKDSKEVTPSTRQETTTQKQSGKTDDPVQTGDSVKYGILVLLMLSAGVTVVVAKSRKEV